MHGGSSEGTRRIDPTLVADVGLDYVLMEEEIFGPIIPIVPVDGVSEAIEIIRGRPSPLVIYVFTDSEETKNKFMWLFELLFNYLSDRLLPYI
ncbi:hypothetical protein B0H13DRAFT_640308 [Mycena leptocephala]|nr:hypothetical protein B0H13DRAFT_640308 [Mycena leptocephala]